MGKYTEKKREAKVLTLTAVSTPAVQKMLTPTPIGQKRSGLQQCPNCVNCLISAIDYWWWGDTLTAPQVIPVTVIIVASFINCLPSDWYHRLLGKCIRWRPKRELPVKDNIITPRERLRSSTC